MSIKDRLMADMKEAMKARQTDRLTVIRSMRSAIRKAEIDGKTDLDDAGVIGIIGRELKMRQDSLEEFKKGNRDDLVEKTKAEIAVIMPYLPKQMSEDEIRTLVKCTIKKIGAAGSKDMGKVMKELMPDVKGKADGKLVNNIVRETLAQ
ncbi:GatB/YqeY domain-containing protein [Pectinatus sottacetonis]|uniref:GatB/YqeY domain-containing protein n=1 Tax=Pectinatus sottacetonis TaxID=1002795 RepID=UPI0018C77699|nr:GatB/YqeY domain-containing protein [Pectinatus sottacetonis]